MSIRAAIGQLCLCQVDLRCSEGEQRFHEEIERDLAGRFRGRILPVDSTVAATWGIMLGEAEAGGGSLPVVDALIGATAKAHGCVVVTRNVDDFKRTGTDVLNPW